MTTSQSLHETLENFQAFILQKEPAIKNVILASDPEVLDTRADVYYKGYSLRLLDTMTMTFPMVQKLVGEELFESLAREYIAQYPSNHFSIRYFGRHFSKFLATHSDIRPEWIEMAAFEWVLGDVIDAADAPHLQFDDFAVLSPEAWADLRLTFHPSLQLLSLSYPIPTLWQALRFNTEPPSMALRESPLTWLIWRYNLLARFVSVDSQQMVMFNAFQAGQTFSDVCALLCDFMNEDQVVNFASQTLRQWISEGVFSTYQI